MSDSLQDPKRLTDADWRSKLTEEQYRVLREKGTELPFSGEHYLEHREGMFHCAACGAPLFSSLTKYDSGCGWPSFWAPESTDAVEFRHDASHGMLRTEVVCKRCGGHLGHVFDDGPSEHGGQRFCINSVSLGFQPKGGK